MEECSAHSILVNELKTDSERMRKTMHEVNNNLQKVFAQTAELDAKIESIVKIPIKNGGGLNITVSLQELMQKLYENIPSDEKVLKFVDNNKEEIASIFDEYRENRTDKKIKRQTDKVKWISGIIALILFFWNIFITWTKK